MLYIYIFFRLLEIKKLLRGYSVDFNIRGERNVIQAYLRGWEGNVFYMFSIREDMSVIQASLRDEECNLLKKKYDTCIDIWVKI